MKKQVVFWRFLREVEGHREVELVGSLGLGGGPSTLTTHSATP